MDRGLNANQIQEVNEFNVKRSPDLMNLFLFQGEPRSI